MVSGFDLVYEKMHSGCASMYECFVMSVSHKSEA